MPMNSKSVALYGKAKLRALRDTRSLPFTVRVMTSPAWYVFLSATSEMLPATGATCLLLTPLFNWVATTEMS